jgi:multidrug resistance protein, MATE family
MNDKNNSTYINESNNINENNHEGNLDVISTFLVSSDELNPTMENLQVNTSIIRNTDNSNISRRTEDNRTSIKIRKASSNFASSTPVLDSGKINQKLEIIPALKEISWIAFPTVFFYMGVFMQQTINLVFIGHTYPENDKKDALDGIGISHLYINCTLLSMVIGIISGFETLGSNAYGAKQYYLLGLYFQRAQLIGFLLTFILLIFHFFYATKIIALFGIEPSVLSYVDEYITIMMFMVIFDIQFSINFRYMNVVEKSNVNIIILALCTFLHPLWCYVFITCLGLGIKGAAYCLIISQFLLSFIGLLYLLIKRPIPESIFFYNKDSFKGWFEYLKIAIPSAFLLCAEWWAFEIMSIIAIWISKLDYTVHILMANFNGNFYAISIGFGMAGSILIGKSICTSTIQVVKKYAIITYLYGIIFMSFFCTIIFFLRKKVLYMYIDQEDVIEKGEDVLIVLCLLNLFDMTQTIFGCVCRGLGKQLIASLIVFINFYITQTSMGILFGKLAHWGVLGIWIGSLISCILCSLGYLIILLKFDWERIQLETLKRIQHDTEILTEEENRNDESFYFNNKQNLLSRSSEF